VVPLTGAALDALHAVADRCGASAQDVAAALFARLAALLAGLHGDKVERCRLTPG